MGSSGIGKALMITGILALAFGIVMVAAVNSGGLCATTLNGGGCASDYSPLTVPTIVGVSLLIVDALAFWGPKPVMTASF